MQKYCPKCGSQSAANANYCVDCGSSLKKVEAEGFNLSFELPELPINISTASCYLLTFVSGMVMLNLDPYRKDPKIRFHAWQSIIFGILWATFVFIERVLTHVFPFLWFIVPFVHIGFFVLWILLIMKAYNKETFKLPIIGDIANMRSKE
jgi:uncharacterized membrane protein